MGEKSVGEKCMVEPSVGEKYMGEKNFGENRGRWDAGVRFPPSQGGKHANNVIFG
jgi:hypothetical protein